MVRPPRFATGSILFFVFFFILFFVIPMPNFIFTFIAAQTAVAATLSPRVESFDDSFPRFIGENAINGVSVRLFVATRYRARGTPRLTD
jgi:hypothetical protein